MGILMLFNVTFLTPAVMVDNLAEKLNECPLYRCRYVYDLECKKWVVSYSGVSNVLKCMEKQSGL